MQCNFAGVLHVQHIFGANLQLLAVVLSSAFANWCNPMGLFIICRVKSLNHFDVESLYLNSLNYTIFYCHVCPDLLLLAARVYKGSDIPF